MKANESKTVGKAEIKKLVIRSSVAERDSAGTKLGRRHFSRTTYLVKVNGRIVDSVSTFAAAETIANAQ